MPQATGYTPQDLNSQNYLKSIPTTDVLLLEGGDKILLENGSDSILLEILSLSATGFTATSLNATGYTET